jgi:hypothetical protein
MAKKKEQERLHLIEILSSTHKWWSSRAIQETLIERYGTHVSHVNSLAYILRILEHQSLIETQTTRMSKLYRWRRPGPESIE